jgi:hypothetical protein
MIFRRPVTMPTEPWDYDPQYGSEDPMPMPVNPPKIVDKPVRKTKPVQVPSGTKPVAARSWTKAGVTVETLASRAFTSNLNVSDIRVMALALLQMQDELLELRERVRELEEK